MGEFNLTQFLQQDIEIEAFVEANILYIHFNCNKGNGGSGTTIRWGQYIPIFPDKLRILMQKTGFNIDVFKRKIGKQTIDSYLVIQEMWKNIIVSRNPFVVTPINGNWKDNDNRKLFFAFILNITDNKLNYDESDWISRMMQLFTLCGREYQPIVEEGSSRSRPPASSRAASAEASAGAASAEASAGAASAAASVGAASAQSPFVSRTESASAGAGEGFSRSPFGLRTAGSASEGFAPSAGKIPTATSLSFGSPSAAEKPTPSLFAKRAKSNEQLLRSRKQRDNEERRKNIEGIKANELKRREEIELKRRSILQQIEIEERNRQIREEEEERIRKELERERRQKEEKERLREESREELYLHNEPEQRMGLGRIGLNPVVSAGLGPIQQGQQYQPAQRLPESPTEIQRPVIDTSGNINRSAEFEENRRQINEQMERIKEEKEKERRLKQLQNVRRRQEREEPKNVNRSMALLLEQVEREKRAKARSEMGEYRGRVPVRVASPPTEIILPTLLTEPPLRTNENRRAAREGVGSERPVPVGEPHRHLLLKNIKFSSQGPIGSTEGRPDFLPAPTSVAVPIGMMEMGEETPTHTHTPNVSSRLRQGVFRPLMLARKATSKRIRNNKSRGPVRQLKGTQGAFGFKSGTSPSGQISSPSEMVEPTIQPYGQVNFGERPEINMNRESRQKQFEQESLERSRVGVEKKPPEGINRRVRAIGMTTQGEPVRQPTRSSRLSPSFPIKNEEPAAAAAGAAASAGKSGPITLLGTTVAPRPPRPSLGKNENTKIMKNHIMSIAKQAGIEIGSLNRMSVEQLQNEHQRVLNILFEKQRQQESRMSQETRARPLALAEEQAGEEPTQIAMPKEPKRNQFVSKTVSSRMPAPMSAPMPVPMSGSMPAPVPRIKRQTDLSQVSSLGPIETNKTIQRKIKERKQNIQNIETLRETLRETYGNKVNIPRNLNGIKNVDLKVLKTTLQLRKEKQNRIQQRRRELEEQAELERAVQEAAALSRAQQKAARAVPARPIAKAAAEASAKAAEEERRRNAEKSRKNAKAAAAKLKRDMERKQIINAEKRRQEAETIRQLERQQRERIKQQLIKEYKKMRGNLSNQELNNKSIGNLRTEVLALKQKRFEYEQTIRTALMRNIMELEPQQNIHSLDNMKTPDLVELKSRLQLEQSEKQEIEREINTILSTFPEGITPPLKNNTSRMSLTKLEEYKKRLEIYKKRLSKGSR